ncbi:MAG: HlyD family secretion protein [Epsilonproteobacteria bacterium]|nr:MAG: HlyD family secretion protein [Campylobacterota bacterium]
MAKEYYAKVKPYETLTIASNVSGIILFADEENEGKELGRKPYIQIDDELDQVELGQVVNKITLLEGSLKLNEKMARNYEAMLEKKQRNYDNIKSLKIKSTIEKDREFYDLISTQNQFISTEKEIQNLKTQINDLHLRQAQLKRSIKDKSLSAEGYVLYKLIVKEGQVVNPASPLAEIANVRRAKLTLYLTSQDMKGAENKTVYINGEKSPYKIDRLWKIADAQHLSSYRAEIIIDAPEYFSSLLKVELKNE